MMVFLWTGGSTGQLGLKQSSSVVSVNQFCEDLLHIWEKGWERETQGYRKRFWVI